MKKATNCKSLIDQWIASGMTKVAGFLIVRIIVPDFGISSSFEECEKT